MGQRWLFSAAGIHRKSSSSNEAFVSEFILYLQRAEDFLSSEIIIQWKLNVLKAFAERPSLTWLLHVLLQAKYKKKFLPTWNIEVWVLPRMEI